MQERSPQIDPWLGVGIKPPTSRSSTPERAKPKKGSFGVAQPLQTPCSHPNLVAPALESAAHSRTHTAAL